MGLAALAGLLAIAALIIFFRSRRALAESAQREAELRGSLSDLRKQSALREAALQVNVSDLQKRSESLGARVSQLSAYEGIVDADVRAKEILADADRRASSFVEKAQEAANAMRMEAERIVAQANADAARARADGTATAEEELKAARVSARELRERAAAELDAATAQAAQVIEAAKKRAEEIAGDAYKAMENAQQWERTAQAMRNVVEGYGDRYIVPTFSLLDELAEEFGFAEAGQRLKAARDRVRRMIKDGEAADCEYKEEVRRKTSIAFVIDAFNGKVDTVLADVRQDNFGTLEQKIKDAFDLVNHLGTPFKDARIKPEYLQARLDELRWAVTAQELRMREREEQRRIKEQIREEERAQKEYERALKETEKEEDLLNKAMEKARRELEKASDDQRAKYEAQLTEMAMKLKEAEEKNKRALSMAQQTKAGHVYIISNEGSFGENVFKIGLTRRLEPEDRIKELGDASVPFEFDVHALIRSEDAPTLERALHKKFVGGQVNKVNARKEFFRVALHEIREQVEKMGCEAAWTMSAACREYKETLAIEKAMRAKSFDQEAWAKAQLKEHDGAMRAAVVKEAVE